MVFNQCWNEKVEGRGWHLGWECPFSCPLEPWWLQRGSPASSHQPADALDLSCRSLPAVFVEPDTSAAVEMDGFLL